MNIFQKKTNQKWQNVLSKINSQKNKQGQENQNDVEEKIKKIIIENPLEELKDYDQIYFLQQNLNKHPFFQDLWQYLSEQLNKKISEEYDQQNGVSESKEFLKNHTNSHYIKNKQSKKSQTSEKRDVQTVKQNEMLHFTRQLKSASANRDEVYVKNQQFKNNDQSKIKGDEQLKLLKQEEGTYKEGLKQEDHDKQQNRMNDKSNKQRSDQALNYNKIQSPKKYHSSEKISIENNPYEYYQKIDEYDRKIREVQRQVESRLQEIQIKLFSHLKLKQYNQNQLIYEDGKIRCDEDCPTKNAKNSKLAKGQYHLQTQSMNENRSIQYEQKDIKLQNSQIQFLQSANDKKKSKEQIDQQGLNNIGQDENGDINNLDQSKSEDKSPSGKSLREQNELEQWQVCTRCQYFYIVWKGEIQEQIGEEMARFSSDGLEIPKTKILGNGEYFGEKELIFRGKRHATIKCLKDTSVFYVNRDIFNSIISSYVKFKNPILSTLDQGAQKTAISLLLKKEHIIQLSYIQQPRTFIYGSVVYNENELADCFYVLSHGQINFSKRIQSQIEHLENSRVTPPKRQQQIYIISEVQYFGEENLYLKNDFEMQEQNDDDDSINIEEKKKCFLNQQKREYTATVSSDKAIVHKIPYTFVLEKIYQKQKNLQKVYLLLNKLVQQKVVWKTKNQERIQKVISNKSLSPYIQGKSANMLVCKTGNPLEKYSLDRLREPEKKSSIQLQPDQRVVNQMTVKNKQRASRILRKMSTVNSIVLTEENQDFQQVLASQNSFSKLQDLTQIAYNALGSYQIYPSQSISPEKKINLNNPSQQQQENEIQQKYFSNQGENNSKLNNQFSQNNVSSKHRRSELRGMKEQDINFLDFIYQREQSDYIKNLNQLQFTPKTVYKQNQIQFNQNASFINSAKNNQNSQFVEKNNIFPSKQNKSNLNVQSKTLFCVDGEKSYSQNQNRGENVIMMKTQNNFQNRNNIAKTPQYNRDISPEMIYQRQENQRRSFILNKGNNLQVQDINDRKQSFLIDQQSKSVSISRKQQNNNYQTTPRQKQQIKNLSKQRLVTDLDEYCKSNTYLEQLIDEKQQLLRDHSSSALDELIFSNNYQLIDDDLQNNSLSKRKQYSAMLEIQKTQQKIPLSISNQKCMMYDLDYEKTSQQVLKFKQKAIKQLIHTKHPVKLDVSSICQQTHRFDYLKRKLEQKKKNLQQMQKFEQGEQTKIPSSAVQYKKSESIVLNLVDNYFKNISSNSGYPQGPCLKSLLQNTPNMQSGNTNINFNTSKNGQQTQYTKSGPTKPYNEALKSSYINYFRSPLKSAQSYRSKSNPRQQNNSKTLQNTNGQKQFSVTNHTFNDVSKDLNQTFSTFLTNTQISPF